MLSTPLEHRYDAPRPPPVPINSQFMIINQHAGNNSLLKNNQASGWGTQNEWVSGWWVVGVVWPLIDIEGTGRKVRGRG
jgi:hypothetical protein